jgi:hypothetical protein
MDLKKFQIDMFDEDGVPSIVFTTDQSIPKYQTLKPIERGFGKVTNQTIIMRNGYINKVILGGVGDDGKNFIKEFVYVGDKSIQMQTGKKETPQAEFEKFKQYIASHTWRDAKTYAQFSPHQYVINFPCWKLKEDGKCTHDCERCKKERAEFEHWVMFIREYGEKVIYGKSNYVCLRVDDKHYWTCGDVLETTWVLNRAITDDSRYKVRMRWVEREN